MEVLTLVFYRCGAATRVVGGVLNERRQAAG
jgi:hypothetical protein